MRQVDAIDARAYADQLAKPAAGSSTWGSGPRAAASGKAGCHEKRYQTLGRTAGHLPDRCARGISDLVVVPVDVGGAFSSRRGRKGECGPAVAGHGSMVIGRPVAVCHSAV